jgi:hypothetical protein
VAKYVRFGVNMWSMMTWESFMSRDLRCSRGILEARGVNRTLEAGGGPNRRCSKEWATCGRSSSKGSRSNSVSSNGEDM